MTIEILNSDEVAMKDLHDEALAKELELDSFVGKTSFDDLWAARMTAERKLRNLENLSDRTMAEKRQLHLLNLYLDGLHAYVDRNF